jgi:hypothetical protein
MNEPLRDERYYRRVQELRSGERLLRNYSGWYCRALAATIRWWRGAVLHDRVDVGG